MSGTDHDAQVDAYWLEGWIRAASVTVQGGTQALERLDRIRSALAAAPTVLPSSPTGGSTAEEAGHE